MSTIIRNMKPLEDLAHLLMAIGMCSSISHRTRKAAADMVTKVQKDIADEHVTALCEMTSARR